jgi:hypothetical protein
LMIVISQGINSLGLIFLTISLFFIVPMSAEITKIKTI